MKRAGKTADRILDAAEKLVQVRGYNAFSYADISKTLGIQKASLHHHFATKAALGEALVARYRRAFMNALETIESETPRTAERLERYTELYGSVLRRKRLCMCGMLATDVVTLPRPMREGVAGFFAENEAWLTRILEAGRGGGELEFGGTATSLASLMVSSLEGAMVVARGSGDTGYFDGVVRRLMENVRPGPAARVAVRKRAGSGKR